MPNKKKQRNAFYYFMKDLQEDFARRGKHYRMDQMPAIAHPEWKKLSQRKQDEYTQRAKDYKEEWKLTEDGKMDSFGVPLAEINKKKKEEAEKEEKMKRNINKSLAIPKLDVIPRKFYFLHFNYACKTEDKMFIPNEVAIVQYSIENGIENEYHEFITPTDIPKGFKLTCLTETEEHGIPHEDFEQANDDYNEIYNSLKKFVKSDKNEKSKRIYTFPDYIEQIEKCFEWLSLKSDEDNVFEVYNAIYLFEKLREICGHPVLSSLANEFFSKTTYNYEANIGCKFHDEKDKMSNCSLSIAKRIAYIMSDYLINENMYDVELIGGQHLPEINDDNFVKMDSKAFQMSKMNKDFKMESKPEPKYSKPVIKTVGRSAVFGPDSADIYGESYDDRNKRSEAVAAPSPKRALRTEPPVKYNEATIGWAPKELQPDFSMDQNDFPSLDDSEPINTNFGRGKQSPKGNVFAKFGSAGFGRGIKKN